PRKRAAAGARLARDRREVARAIAQQRQRFLRQRREDELADIAVVDGLAALRIDDLDEKVILAHVRAVTRLDALERDARAHHLRQAVDVDGFQPETRLDLLSEPLRPRLAAEDAGA